MNRYQALCRTSRRAFWFALPAVLLFTSAAQGMYDPHHGRWFQRDPLGVRPDAPRGYLVLNRQYLDGPNLCEYVNSKPQKLVDPDGRCKRKECPGDPYDYCARLHDPFWDEPGFSVCMEAEADCCPKPWGGDKVEFYCYSPIWGDWGSGQSMRHCDVKCTDTSGHSWLAGGTGVGPSPDGNGNPGWRYKNLSEKQGDYGGALEVPAGTCACIVRKGVALNSIPGKLYDVPTNDIARTNGQMINISNSNAAASTLLRCCNVNAGVPSGAEGAYTVPGWGNNVMRRCCGPLWYQPIGPCTVAKRQDRCLIGCGDLK